MGNTCLKDTEASTLPFRRSAALGSKRWTSVVYSRVFMKYKLSCADVCVSAKCKGSGDLLLKVKCILRDTSCALPENLFK